MSRCTNELKICHILSKLKHNNIVKIYRIGVNFIDMELLSIIPDNTNNLIEIKEKMFNLKIYLQSAGIMYIDWKLDNIGLDKDNNYKLFDFDGSGIINTTTNQWINEPNYYYLFRKAIELGIRCPIEIDNWTFDYWKV